MLMNFAVAYTLNVVSKCRISLYLNTHRLQTDPGQFFLGSWKSRGFFISETVGTLWHAPLGVRRAKCRHQSPEWTILSHINCFIQGEIIGLQVLLDSLYPCSTRTSWWSPPVLQVESCYDLGICFNWHSRNVAEQGETLCLDNSLERCGCFVFWWVLRPVMLLQHVTVCCHCLMISYIVTVCGQLAKAAFQASKDPLDAAVFYLAMRKKSMLWGLFRWVFQILLHYCVLEHSLDLLLVSVHLV